MNALNHTVLIALPHSHSGSDGLLLQILLSEAPPEIGLSGLTTVTTSSIDDAVALIGRGVPDVVLLKARFDTDRGRETLRKLRRLAPDVPLVAIADGYDRELARRVLDLGAHDCLLKGELSSAVLGRALKYAIERQRNVTTLRRLYRYDPLTGLLTQPALIDILERLLERRRSQPQCIFAVLVLEISDLHDLSRHHGRSFGDEILIAIAHRLQQAARPGDPLARLDGDEFVLVLPSLQGRPDSAAVAVRLRGLLGAPLPVREQLVELRFRCGLALSEQPFDGPHDMLGAAVLRLKRS